MAVPSIIHIYDKKCIFNGFKAMTQEYFMKINIKINIDINIENW